MGQIFKYSEINNPNFNILLTHEGMCNLMLYIFYDVYRSKKNCTPYYGFAKPLNYSRTKWHWNYNVVFEWINEYVYYQVNADKFWTNFSQELL